MFAGAETIAREPRTAFLSDDAIEILQFAAQSIDAGYATALVTLVEIRGGAARALGAQMVVREDGLYCGFVSGGCTEATVAAEAMIAIEHGEDRELRLGAGSPYFDIVLPCGGGITLAIHVIRDGRIFRKVMAALRLRTPARLRYHAFSRTLVFETGEGPTGWDGDCFLRMYRPREKLLLSGSSIETGAVARVAAAAGYEVLVIDRDHVPEAHQVDQDTAVALLHHDVDRELPLLTRAMASPAFYIGALGSRRTHAKRCAALQKLGYSEMSPLLAFAQGLAPLWQALGRHSVHQCKDIAAGVARGCAVAIPSKRSRRGVIPAWSDGVTCWHISAALRRMSIRPNVSGSG